MKLSYRNHIATAKVTVICSKYSLSHVLYEINILLISSFVLDVILAFLCIVLPAGSNRIELKFGLTFYDMM